VKIPYYFFVALLAAFLMQACSSFYFGHTKAEWNTLTEKEKIAAKKDYQTIIGSRSNQAHTNQINARTQSVIDRGTIGAKP
jgi:hypothetical protein